MNQKWVGTGLGIFQIVIAVWFFTWNNVNQITVSIILLLSGLSLVLQQLKGELVNKVGNIFQCIAVLLAVILFFVVLIEKLLS